MTSQHETDYQYEVELHDIVKTFPKVTANDHIDVAVRKGEIKALVGENGAGKTTLMNILYGLYRPDKGHILIRGREHEFNSPYDAILAGLGMVHQHFMLFPSLTVLDNIIYGAEPTLGGFIRSAHAEKRIREISAGYGLNVPLNERVSSLPVGVKQRVEILKTLYRDASVLILDEPTAVLTPQERDTLFSILRNLAKQGKTIIFITHKLQEVMDISDTATVLRDGRVTAELETANTNPNEITRYMVGREVMLHVNKQEASPGKDIITVNDLSVRNEYERYLVSHVDFSVREGEIVGIAGVAGNGQSELIKALTGLIDVSEGRIDFAGQEITSFDVARRRDIGISYVPEDRTDRGLAEEASVGENIIMGYQHKNFLSNHGVLKRDKINDHSISILKSYDIKSSGPAVTTSSLSGGNQQKLVVAREMEHQSLLLIAEQPTRGVDVGSIESIHQDLISFRDKGNAVLLVSSELNEVMFLSDRILVMYEGEIVGEMASKEATEEKLGLLMAGGTKYYDE